MVLEYLIECYSKVGEVVLDFTMGSGSVGVACEWLGREFIGVERDEGVFEKVKEILKPKRMFQGDETTEMMNHQND